MSYNPVGALRDETSASTSRQRSWTKPFSRGGLVEIVDKILKPEKILEGMTALVVDDSEVARSIVVENLHLNTGIWNAYGACSKAFTRGVQTYS